MFILDVIAEERIARALAAGEFDDLPGAGKPVELDDDAMVPRELRMAYRVLKNAGWLPPEVEALKEAVGLERLLRTIDDSGARAKAVTRLNMLRARLAENRRGTRIEPCYLDRMLEKLG
jgi:DnaJ-like protein